MPVKDGPSCPSCGLPNYEGLCPVCRGDYNEAVDEGLWPRDEPQPSSTEGEDEPECP